MGRLRRLENRVMERAVILIQTSFRKFQKEKIFRRAYAVQCEQSSCCVVLIVLTMVELYVRCYDVHFACASFIGAWPRSVAPRK
jgi:coenzyme F420-reducing hydrogenase alpha subunit